MLRFDTSKTVLMVQMVSTPILYHEARCPASAKLTCRANAGGLQRHDAVISTGGGGTSGNPGGGLIYLHVRYGAERFCQVINLTVVVFLCETHFSTHFKIADETEERFIILPRCWVFDINHHHAAWGIGIITIFAGAFIFDVFEDPEAGNLCGMVAFVRAISRAVAAGDFEGTQVVCLYGINREEFCIIRQRGGNKSRSCCGKKEHNVFDGFHGVRVFWLR